MEDLRSLTSASNGAQSSGPVTAEGKAASARNAEKHGIYAHCVVLRSESAEAYAQLRGQYQQQFQPRTALEAELVDQLTAASWRLRRFAGFETAAIDYATAASAGEADATFTAIDPETRSYLAYDRLAQSNTTLNTLTRAQLAQVRQFNQALRHLREIEKLRNEPTFSEAKSE